MVNRSILFLINNWQLFRLAMRCPTQFFTWRCTSSTLGGACRWRLRHFQWCCGIWARRPSFPTRPDVWNANQWSSSDLGKNPSSGSGSLVRQQEWNVRRHRQPWSWRCALEMFHREVQRWDQRRRCDPLEAQVFWGLAPGSSGSNAQPAGKPGLCRRNGHRFKGYARYGRQAAVFRFHVWKLVMATIGAWKLNKYYLSRD